MFERDQRRVGVYARRGPEEMARVITFVYLTIQQGLYTVPEAMRDVEREGEASRFLWGFKGEAYRWLKAHKTDVYHVAMALWDAAECEADAQRMLLGYFAELPGLGPVKAGFVVQLCFGLGGCLDTHHIARFNLNGGGTHPPAWMRAWHYKKASPKLKARYIDAYLDAIKEFGGTQVLWDDWCEHVARVWAGRYRDADHVSALHCEALGLN